MLQPPRPTVYIETYGCQMNVSDTELMLGKLIESGYESVAEPDGADVILINTCAIREHAEQRVIGRIGEMKSRMKQGAVVGVTGCMAQRLGAKLLDRAKHVSLVIGPDGYRDLPSLIESARRGVRTTATDFDLEEHYEDFTPRRFEDEAEYVYLEHVSRHGSRLGDRRVDPAEQSGKCGEDLPGHFCASRMIS